MRNLWRVCRCLALQMKVLSNLYSVILYRPPHPPKKNQNFFFPFFPYSIQREALYKTPPPQCTCGDQHLLSSARPNFQQTLRLRNTSGQREEGKRHLKKLLNTGFKQRSLLISAVRRVSGTVGMTT